MNSERPPSLFGSGAGSDPAPAPYERSAYESLRSAHGAEASRVRELVDRWYSRLDEPAALSIAERFTRENDADHRGAFFELYLHELAVQLYGAVDADIGQDEFDRRRPDFGIDCAGHPVWIEATSVAGDDFYTPSERRHRHQVLDAINSVEAPAFGVHIEFLETSAATPPAGRLRRWLQRWLDNLDPDEILRRPDGEAEPRVFDRGGWRIELVPYALEPEHRNYPHHRLIGSLGDGGAINETAPIKKRLRKKAGHYGALEQPFVIAVLCAGSFVDDQDITDALLGPRGYWYDHEAGTLRGVRQPDGLWLHETGPVNTRVSAVLSVPKLSPWNICEVEPTLWTNPWAAHPVPTQCLWRRMDLETTGKVHERKAARCVADVLHLPRDWPAIVATDT